MTEKPPQIALYEFEQPHKEGLLEVSSLHKIYWEISGNPEGKPAIFLHGGPGALSLDFCRGFFDHKVYRIIQIDQRGCGKSHPFGTLEENTTQELVEDIEKVRKHLSIEKWHTVFGGSWGSTLALLYAEAHPDRVGHLVMFGTFLGYRKDLQFFYQEGASWLFPEQHQVLKQMLPEVQQGDIIQNYYLKLIGSDKEEAIKFAKVWARWELSCFALFPDEHFINMADDGEFALAIARIESHYFVNGFFFRSENQILEDIHKIAHIPTVIVQGRYDVIAPAKSAWALHKQMKNSELIFIPDAGHSFVEPGTVHALVSATDRFKADP